MKFLLTGGELAAVGAIGNHHHDHQQQSVIIENNPFEEWLTNKSWQELNKYAEIKLDKHLIENFTQNVGLFLYIFDVVAYII